MWQSNHVVQLVWFGGGIETKDLWPMLANHRSLARLRNDDALFKTARASQDGQHILWDGGITASLGMVMAIPNLTMTAPELRSFMAEFGYSSEGLAAVLQISRRAVTDYRAGAPIPTAIVLAVRYLTYFRGLGA